VEEPDARLNARGWKCPLPVLKAAGLLALAAPGETLLVEATDAMSGKDFREWVAAEGKAEIVLQDEARDEDGTCVYRHLLRRT
jgi:tRNA 2-thiouridine synthesizing protein A